MSFANAATQPGQVDEAVHDVAALLDEAVFHLERWDRLLDELLQLRDLHEREDSTKGHLPGLAGLIGRCRNDRQSIEKKVSSSVRGRSAAPEEGAAAAAEAQAPAPALSQLNVLLGSSNWVFADALWSALKRASALGRLDCRYPRTRFTREDVRRAGQGRGSGAAAARRKWRERRSARVDAVVEHGAEWLRVGCISERRLLHQMARAGSAMWDEGDGDEEEEDAGDGVGDEISDSDDDDDGDDEVHVFKAARHLVQAARLVTVPQKGGHPRVHVVLSRIEEGKVDAVDALIRRMRAMGGDDVEVVVDCANSDYMLQAVPELDQVLANLVITDKSRTYTETLNLDASVCLGLCSDLSHLRSEPSWDRKKDNTSTWKRIEEEASGQHFVNTVYPVLGSRKLVASQVSADHIRQLVHLIGTETEVARFNLILPEAGSPEKPPDTVRAEFQKLSVHAVPPDLQLPIEVADGAVEFEDMREVAEEVFQGVKEPTRSVFLYGWASGCTTVTSNSEVTKRIFRILEQSHSGVAGPDIWAGAPCRPLLTKPREKRRV